MHLREQRVRQQSCRREKGSGRAAAGEFKVRQQRPPKTKESLLFLLRLAPHPLPPPTSTAPPLSSALLNNSSPTHESIRPRMTPENRAQTCPRWRLRHLTARPDGQQTVPLPPSQSPRCRRIPIAGVVAVIVVVIVVISATTGIVTSSSPYHRRRRRPCH